MFLFFNYLIDFDVRIIKFTEKSTIIKCIAYYYILNLQIININLEDYLYTI